MSVFFAKLASFAKMRRPLKSRSTAARKTLFAMEIMNDKRFHQY